MRKSIQLPLLHLIALSALLLALSVSAEELVVGETDLIGLTADRSFLHVIRAGRSVKVQGGAIPSSINNPLSLFGDANSPRMVHGFESFRALRRVDMSVFLRRQVEMGFIDGDEKTEKWDYTNAKMRVLWCSGQAYGQFPSAIKGLLKAGCPAEMISYYRGWHADVAAMGSFLSDVKEYKCVG